MSKAASSNIEMRSGTIVADLSTPVFNLSRLFDESMEYSIECDEYKARFLNTNEDVLESYRLRYKIVVEELQWIGPPIPGTTFEYDIYDEVSIPFGVFNDENELVAYARLIPDSELGLMAFNELKGFVEDSRIPEHLNNETAEVSRLIVRSDCRKPSLYLKLTRMLYRIMYQWSITNNFSTWVFVSEERAMRILRNVHKFPVHLMGIGYDKQDSSRAICSAWLRLSEVEKRLGRIDGEMLSWYQEGISWSSENAC